MGFGMASKVGATISPTRGFYSSQSSILLTFAPLYSLFFKKEMELSLIGLQNAGKTSLVNVIATGAFHEDMIPTVGFNMRKVTKGAVTIKLWDLGGQVQVFPYLFSL